MIILGLGSNIGDRLGYLSAAVRGLGAVMQDMRLSRILESEAVLPPDATPEMNRPFLNMALRGTCHLAPEALLQQLKILETTLGRQQRCQWGPREIDMDILAMGGYVLESAALNIPHRELLNRDFALLPLADVAPEWTYPLPGEYFGKTPSQIIAGKGYGLNSRLRETGMAIHE